MMNKYFNGLCDGIYVMRHDHSLLVKRLQLLPSSIIKVKSDNNMVEPWEINKKAFEWKRYRINWPCGLVRTKDVNYG